MLIMAILSHSRELTACSIDNASLITYNILHIFYYVLGLRECTMFNLAVHIAVMI